ncbi:hypothetical protein [Natronorubrum sulfidifaciens]|uniref:Uncharacterized protein n=1 Tax=Natronorubrum sulfidifaciens JCM 14089 TaxID=1230460 RepID=L9W766_9EURY|nr:hypothetical protein [Natronorubrum sulfidifaciens]ELY45182.1 hypothetical protein C495_09575 [Natronorubrum sulfidifaciens JCM 14089]
MSWLSSLRDGLTDDSLRIAILVGLASIPFTIALSWGSVSSGDGVVIGGSISGIPLLLAGLFVGSLYHDRATESRRAGFWTGLIGSSATAFIFTANTLASIGTLSSRQTVVAVAVMPGAIILGGGISVLVTMVSAAFADWVRTRVDSEHRVVESADAGETAVADSRWWLVVAVYALAAPVVLYYALGVRPDSGLEVGLMVAGLFVLVPLSIVALVGLFIDATTPRSRATDWLPSVWLYVGSPIGVAVAVYLLGVVRGVSYPPGYASYSFLGTLWFLSVGYLVNRTRHLGG